MTIANCPGISKIATTKMTVQPAPPSRSLSLFHIIFHMICLKRCRLTIAERRPLSFRLPRLKTSENTNERSPHPRNRRAAALVRHSPQPRKEENCGSDSFVARGLQISAAKCAAHSRAGYRFGSTARRVAGLRLDSVLLLRLIELLLQVLYLMQNLCFKSG